MTKKADQAKKEKAAEEEAAATSATAEGTTPMACDSTNPTTEAEPKEESGGLSLLGIGGKQIKGGAAKKGGKKRTPGEIRIQKGKIRYPIPFSTPLFLYSHALNYICNGTHRYC